MYPEKEEEDEKTTDWMKTQHEIRKKTNSMVYRKLYKTTVNVNKVRLV